MRRPAAVHERLAQNCPQLQPLAVCLPSFGDGGLSSQSGPTPRRPGIHLNLTVHLVRIRTKKWNSRELDSQGEEKASGQCGARRSQAEDRTPTQKLSALRNAHRKPDKVPCAFWDVRMVLRISHRCACMCVRACTRAQMGVCVLVYLHMYLSTRVHDYPVCMGLYVRVCTCVHVRMHVHARVFMHVCILLCLRAMRTCGYARMRDHVLMCMSALRYASL